MNSCQSCPHRRSSYSLAHWHTPQELATKAKKSLVPGTAKFWRSEDEHWNKRGEPNGEDDRGERFVMGEADGNRGKRNRKGNQMRVAAVGLTALTVRGTGEGNVRQKREVGVAVMVKEREEGVGSKEKGNRGRRRQ
uniref:Uncharacterized protein n=1 Tax=Salix viminalis TaxID=40686 RepID=A0A6N2L0W7_SALVM